MTLAEGRSGDGMVPQMVLWGARWTTSSIPHLLLAEAGAAFEVRFLSLKDGEHRRPEYLAVNPKGEVPALVVGQRVVTEIPVGTEPEGMGMSPDGKVMVATSETTNMAHFIDTSSNQIVSNVLVDARPRVAQFTADGKQVWVSSEIGGTVSVIDTESRKVTNKVRFAIPGVPKESIQPVGIALTADQKTAFVALGPANRVAVVDAQTYEVKRYLLVGQRVWNLAFSGDGKRLYTTNGVSNDMSVIDTEALRVTRSVPVGQLPWGIVVAP